VFYRHYETQYTFHVVHLLIQGHSLFSFKTISGRIGRGIIDTNWSLGLNRKITNLYYDQNGFEVVLDHSNETLTIKRGGFTTLEKDFTDGNSRLENHYVGVFNDLAQSFQSGISNIDYATEIHKFLFKAIGAIKTN